MKTKFSLFLGLLLSASSAFAGEFNLLGDLGRLGGLFDGKRADILEVSPPPTMPAPNTGDWGVPSIQGVPIEALNKHRDVFKEIQSCEAVDFMYFRQPSAAEAIGSLSDCLSALSKRYGVAITAAEGRTGIVLMVSGLIPPGSTVKSDLATALQLRNGKLFGIPSALLDLERPASDRQTSSLQPIVDRCPNSPRSVADAAAFVEAFGKCVRSQGNFHHRDARRREGWDARSNLQPGPEASDP